MVKSIKNTLNLLNNNRHVTINLSSLEGIPILEKNLNCTIQANRLYLATMLLVVSVGALLQSLSFSWGLLLTELLFLILLPTL